jgi:hypothetical protein
MKLFFPIFFSTLTASSLIHYAFELSKGDIEAIEGQVRNFGQIEYMNFLKSIFLPDLVNFFSQTFEKGNDESFRRYRKAILIKYRMLAGEMAKEKILKELETFDVKRIYVHTFAMTNPDPICARSKYKFGQEDFPIVKEYLEGMIAAEQVKGANINWINLINSLINRAHQHAFGVAGNI